jgi:glycosyltransferase involved in cell wall biosynthesis
MDTIKVTVGIPVYNGAKFIKETLDSVANQSCTAIKVLIIDDCSTDNSVNIIQNWLIGKGESYELIINSNNLGLLKCSNILLSQVKTTYFQLLGHDDIIYPNKIEDQVKLLESTDDSVAMVYCNMHVVDKLGNKIASSFFERAEYFGKPPDGYIYNELIKGNFINASSVLCKTKFVVAQGGYDENLFFEDWPMWIKLSSKFKVLFLQSFLGAYRILDNSMIHANINKQIAAENTFYMYLKFLKSNYPNQDYLKSMVKKYAIFCYKLGSNKAKKYLGTALYYKFNFKVFIYYILCTSKINTKNTFSK